MSSRTEMYKQAIVEKITGNTITVACPYCLEDHYHGAGGDPKNPRLGWRLSDCKDVSKRKDYELVMKK